MERNGIIGMTSMTLTDFNKPPFLCMIGLHTYGDWKNIKQTTDNKLLIRRYCIHCNHKQEKKI